MRLLAWLVGVGFVGAGVGYAQVTTQSCPLNAPMRTFISQSGMTTHLAQMPVQAPVQVAYSLVRAHTQVQTLSNGVQITNRSETREWRDAEGRTRYETRAETDAGTEVQTVFINDPVLRENITLYPRAKVAQINRFAAAPSVAANQVRPVDKAFQEAMKPQYEPLEGLVSKIENKTEQLGAALIAGECAQGERWTRIIPAGGMGNDGELRMVNESWTSPRLGIQLRTVIDDPNSGHIVDEVTELHVGDPAPSWFQPPPDYQVFDLTRDPAKQ